VQNSNFYVGCAQPTTNVLSAAQAKACGYKIFYELIMEEP